MHLVDETTRKSKKAPRDRLAPIQDTTKVLEWGALHGFDVENEVLKALKSGSEGSEGGLVRIVYDFTLHSRLCTRPPSTRSMQ